MERKHLLKRLQNVRSKRLSGLVRFVKKTKKTFVRKTSRVIKSFSKTALLKLEKRKSKKHFQWFHSDFLRRHIVRFSIFAAVIAVMVAGTSFYTKAEYAKFYPSACLGGWENTKNAEGEPEVPRKGDPSLFNSENSAVLDSAASQIFCGSFIGDMPKDAEMKTLLLKLSWTARDKEEESVAIASSALLTKEEAELIESAGEESAATTTITVSLGEEVASSTQEILDAPEGAVIELNLSETPAEIPAEKEKGTEESSKKEEEKKAGGNAQETPSTEPSVPEQSPASKSSSSESSPEPAPESVPPSPEPQALTEQSPAPESAAPAPAPELPPPPPPAPAPESAPVSFFDRLFRGQFSVAFAETLSGDTTTTTADSLSRLNLDSESATATAETVATAGESEAVAAQENTPASPELLEVLYTLDGQEWYSLGEVSKSEWTGTFEIPISEWEDISRLQVSIQSLSSIDELPKIYLDGMWLEADYGRYKEGWSEDMYATEDEVAGLPEVRVEGNKIFHFSKTDFRADEDPMFELIPRADISSTTEMVLPVTAEPATTTETIGEIAATSTDPQTEIKDAAGTITDETQNVSFFEEQRRKTPLSLRLVRRIKNFFTVHAASGNNIKIVRVKVADRNGTELPDAADIEMVNGKPSVRVARSKDHFRPGRYELRVDVLYNKKIFSSVQEFTWGVLAINADKSIYLPGETAYLQMAALDDLGYNLCSSDLKLEVESPSFEKTVFITKASSTVTGEEKVIGQTPFCSRNNVTDLPDYFAHYIVSGTGTYRMTLTNLENGYRITDVFEARASVPFDVARTGATRINPFASEYTMKINVSAKQDFSGEIIEPLPEDFDIIESATSSPFRIEESGSKKYVVWDVSLKNGDVLELSYTYQAPRVSPQFYLLGPLRFEESRNWLQKLAGMLSSEGSLFEEARRWQIAVDAEATIDSSVYTTIGFMKHAPAMVFISDQVGFMFYSDTTAEFGYASTTDGGSTWSAFARVSTRTNAAGGVWYDRWTPGDTGTKIHFGYMDSSADDYYYNYLDVGSPAPTFGSEVVVATTTTISSGVDNVAVTKATDGILYVAVGDGTLAGVSKVVKCSSACDNALNWSATATNPLDQTNDFLRLVPLGNGNVMLLKDDISADDILSNVYSATSTSWWGWVTIDANAIDHASQLETIAPTIDEATGKVYLAYGADVGGTNIADIRTAVWDPATLAWTAETDVVTNSTTTNHYIALDKNTGDIYVTYARGNPGSATDVYYKKSTDGMASWGAETKVNTATGSLRWVQTNISSNQRIFSTYELDSTTDVLYGNTVADLVPPTFEQASYRIFANANSTDVGSALAATNTAATLSAAGDAFRLRVNMHVAGGDLGQSRQGFKLQFAQKSGTCDTAFSGESYSDVTSSSVIAFNDNSTPADGAALTANANDPLHGTPEHTLKPQTYIESNNATNTVSRISTGEDALWDFSLKDNSAPGSTAYCFRMATSSAAYILDSNFSYTVVPEISTAAAATLTLVVDTDSFGTLTPGTYKFATSTVSVTSSGADWNVTMYGNNQGSLSASTTLYYSTGPDYTIGIPDQTEWIPGAATTSAGNAVVRGSLDSSGNVLAFRVMTASGSPQFRATTWWGADDTDGTAKWAGIASTSAANKRITISSVAAPSAVLGTIQYYLNVPSTQQAGAYTGDLTFTLTGAP